ncbi:MAG: NusG domain II-containing protein [Ignavibacteriales bacterium]
MTDRRIIFAVLLIAGALWLGLGYVGGYRGEVVVVNVQGVDVERLPLEPAREPVNRTVQGAIGRSTFEISGGRVRMISSDCPDKVCVKMGWISQAGQVIVCLPNRVILKVEPR